MDFPKFRAVLTDEEKKGLDPILELLEPNFDPLRFLEMDIKAGVNTLKNHLDVFKSMEAGKVKQISIVNFGPPQKRGRAAITELDRTYWNLDLKNDAKVVLDHGNFTAGYVI